MALNCAWQDLLGKERYIAHVQSGWVNTPWWLWAAVAIGCLLIEGTADYKAKARGG